MEDYNPIKVTESNKWGHTIDDDDYGVSDIDSFTSETNKQPKIKKALKKEIGHQANSAVAAEDVWERHYDYSNEFTALAGDIYYDYEKKFKKDQGFIQKNLAHGVQRNIESGIFDTSSSTHLLARGFWAQEWQPIQDQFDSLDDYSEERFEATKALEIRIQKLLDNESKGISAKELSTAKHDGSMDAIYTGARIDERSHKVVFSIPLDRGAEIVDYMKDAGVDFENDKEARQESYHGFISVLEAIKSDHSLTDDGFKALDWYYDNFNYNKNSDEFIDSLEGYTQEADFSFQEKFDEYLDYRDEIKRMQVQNISRDQSTLEMLSDLVAVATGRDLDGLSLEELFLYQDHNAPKQQIGQRKKTSWPTRGQKTAAAQPKLEAIVKLDPDATFYRGEIFKKNNHPYLIVRFGANSMNNVIVIPYGDSSDAMFCWKGETGDDRDGWKAYFKNASIRTRNTEVKRFQCNGFSQDQVGAINQEWDRIENYLGIKLPDYEVLAEDSTVPPDITELATAEAQERSGIQAATSEEANTA